MSEPAELETQRSVSSRCEAGAMAAERPAGSPWMSLTKGECLLLALALHRLSRANARPATRSQEEP
jgi:hypothetical protein